MNKRDVKHLKQQPDAKENRALRSVRRSVDWRNQRLASVTSRRNIDENDVFDTSEMEVDEVFTFADKNQLQEPAKPDQQRVLQERLQKWREEKANRKKQVEQRLGPSKPFAFRHADQVISFDKPLTKLAPLPQAKVPAAAAIPQTKPVRGASSTTSAASRTTVTAADKVTTKPATSAAKVKAAPAKSTDKPVVAPAGEPVKRVTRSQVTAPKPPVNSKPVPVPVKAAPAARNTRTASTAVDKPSTSTQVKMSSASSSSAKDKPAAATGSRMATRGKGKDTEASSKTKDTTDSGKGKVIVPAPVNKGRGGRAGSKSQTPAAGDSRTSSSGVLQPTPASAPPPPPPADSAAITPDATPADNGRVNFTRGRTSFAPEHHQFVAPESLAGSQFVYRAPDNLLAMSFKPMSPASISRFFGKLPADDDSKSPAPVARMKTPRRRTSRALVNQQPTHTDVPDGGHTDMADGGHTDMADEGHTDMAVADKELTGATLNDEGHTDTAVDEGRTDMPVADGGLTDMPAADGGLAEATLRDEGQTDAAAAGGGHSYLTSEVTLAENKVTEEGPVTVDCVLAVDNSSEAMVTEETGEVNQLAGTVGRMNLVSSESSYVTAAEFMSPPSRPVFTSSSSNGSTTRASSHRRSVSSVPFRRRETQKLLQNSLILQSLSPEECVEILRQSPMVEMTRRRRSVMSPATPLTASHTAGDKGDTGASSHAGDRECVTSVSDRSEACSSTSSVGDSVDVDLPVPGTVPYYRKLIIDETGRLVALCCKWNRLNDDTDDLPEKVRGEIRSFIGQAELLMAQRFKQFSSLIDNCEFALGEKQTTCTDLQGFWEMIYCQVDDVNKKFDKLNMMHASNWQYSTPVMAAKTKKVTKVTKKPAATGQATTVSRFAAFRAAQKTSAKADTEQSPAVPADIVSEPTGDSAQPVVEVAAILPAEEVAAILPDDVQQRQDSGTGDVQVSQEEQDVVKEVSHRRTRKSSHTVTFSAQASTRRSTRLSSVVQASDDDVMGDLVPVSLTLTPSTHQQTPRMARHKRVSELLYSPVPASPSHTTPVAAATEGSDLMCFTPSDDDQPSAKMATTRRSMNVGHTPHPVAARQPRRSERKSLAL